MEWSDQNGASHHICGMSSQPSYHIILYYVISLLLIIRFRSISISCQYQICFSRRCMLWNYESYERPWGKHAPGLTWSGLSTYTTYIFIYCTIYCILYTVYCILYPQEATYQLPKEGPNVAHVTISATTAKRWPTWKMFHKWQSKVSWLKGLVHMWSLVYNLVMSYLLLALCVLKSRYFIQY